MTQSFRYVGDDVYRGVPQRDLSPEDFAELSPKRQSLVLASASYEAATLKDPLGELDDDALAALAPAEKAKRTKEANARAEAAEAEAARLAEEAAQASAGATEGGNGADAATEEV